MYISMLCVCVVCVGIGRHQLSCVWIKSAAFADTGWCSIVESWRSSQAHLASTCVMLVGGYVRLLAPKGGSACHVRQLPGPITALV
jgi:hypothetical protein